MLYLTAEYLEKIEVFVNWRGRNGFWGVRKGQSHHRCWVQKKVDQEYADIQYLTFTSTTLSNHIPSFQPLEKPPSSIIGAWPPPTQSW